ncbi:MAG: NAD-dependent epimerase/dehydratase family protein [Flavobacterium circumlabens]|uniref:NAD-dependent epimerase/dehydratase family protein n=1 Tax=Flavobacterium circumlabens TaxID=2133765 RepID=UPI003265F34E
MEVEITGASGFLGINLQEYLKEYFIVKPKSIRYSEKQKIQINADAIIHLAGKAHDLKNISAPNDYYEANFELTKQLFDSFLSSESKVFIFMSTVKAVADVVKEKVLTEESIPDPKTHYGISKFKAEQYILNGKLPDAKRVYVLRPCMIHGPGNKGNLNLLYKFVSKKIPWPLGAYDNQRSFLSIENICFVIKELLENTNIPSGVYQVADDEPLSTNELIELIGTSLSKKSNIWKIPTFLINKTAILGDHLHLPLNSERLKKLTEDYVISNAKIKKELKKELPVSARAGLIRTINSFKDK